MKKKIVPLLLIMLFLIPMQSLAVGEFEVIELYDPYDLITVQPYYNSAQDSISLSISGTRAVKVHFATYDSTFTTPGSTKYRYPSDYGWHYFNGMGFNCNVYYLGELYDSQDNLLVRAKLHITGLVNPLCDSGSDGVGGGSNECDSCAIFDCPGWSQYMGKLDEIKNAIPPPPNWDQVSQTFSNAIVPRLVSETRTMLSELLGTAPSPPAAPPDLSGPSDRGFSNAQPTMPNVPGLSGFDSNDVKQGAPVIPHVEDPTGGFDLTVNPVGSLPDVVPGGDPGPYKRDPIEMPATYPEDSIDTMPTPGAPNDPAPSPPAPDDAAPTPPVPGDSENMPPTPGEDGNTPPIPGDSGGTVPKPGENSDNPPVPGGGQTGLPDKEYYMSQPGGG